MPAIAISRNYGSGGRRLGRHVARVLGWDYVDKRYFQKIAEELNVSPQTLESFEHGWQYRVAKTFYRAFSKQYIERIVGYDSSVVEEADYQRALRELVLGVAGQGNVVIVGRGAHFFLKDRKDCCRFRLVASHGWRRRYAVKYHQCNPAEVDHILEMRDRNREWFLRSVCGNDFDSPHLYHLTINMDLVPFEVAAQLILSVLQATAEE